MSEQPPSDSFERWESREAERRAWLSMSELCCVCAVGSPTRAGVELKQGRGSSLEVDEQDEVAPLPPPGGPRSGELAWT